MPRLNIEEEAFGDSRLERLARLIRKSSFDKDDLSHRAALGFMAFVWKASQEAGKAIASASEIDVWSGVDGFHILALEAGYLRRTEDGLFEIRGNAKQIEGLNAWREQRKIAGQASAKARAATAVNGRSTAVQQPFDGRSTAVQQPSTGDERNPTQLQDQFQIQRSIDQANLGEGGFGLRPSPPPEEPQEGVLGCLSIDPPPNDAPRSGKPPKTPRRKPAEKNPALSTRMIEAYAESYSKAYPQSPALEADARTRAQMALIRRVCASDEEAIAFCAWYPSCAARQWDVRKSHDLGTFVSDRGPLLGYFRSGRNPDTTAEMIRRQSKIPIRSGARD